MGASVGDTSSSVAVSSASPCASSSSAPPLGDEALDSAGQVPLWEWSKVVVMDRANVPSGAWGVYAANDAIEAAFQAGKSKAEVMVGIRTYKIIFDKFLQADFNHGHGEPKVRYVRRRLVSPAERIAALRAASKSWRGPSEDRCIICQESYDDTPEVPLRRLRGCDHCFHGACVQRVLDKGRPCPLCRAPTSASAGEGQEKDDDCSNEENMTHKRSNEKAWEGDRDVASAEPAAGAATRPGQELLLRAQQGALDSVDALLRSRADVDFRSVRNATPLMSAAMCGHAEVVRLLLAHGAGVNLVSDAGHTAVFLAAFHGRLQTSELLLQAGADTSIRNNDGVTAATAAAMRGHHEVHALLVRGLVSP
mmetsp:Transcript_54336/g.151326  ORF Transcript_54336/g.151326 Transcript_54336/m.151326 type:complete len:365 (+) Transcript_54336:121-1215(+)